MQRYYCIELALNVAVKNLLSQWNLMFCSVHIRLKKDTTKCKLCGNEPVLLFYQTSKSLPVGWKLQQHFCMKETKHWNNNCHKPSAAATCRAVRPS